ncbi:NADH--cytochrome b5 reductase [Trifolium repens]|nr:NADH--cytochrome b5 reductase [Trifolium repens]
MVADSKICSQGQRGDYGLQPELKLNGLYDCLFSCLIQSNDLPSAIIALKAHLTSFLGDITPLPDNSLQEVCEQLVAMYQECLQGDLSSIQIIKEANSWKKANNKYEVETDDPFFERRRKQALITARDRVWEEMLFEARIKYLKKIKKFKKARLLIRGRKQKMASKFQMETPSSISIQLTQKANISCPLMHKQANSSEMDGFNLPNWIRVFKEGVDLLMNNLWLYIPCGCGSTSKSSHSLMIQRHADYILFWFTQTIKPVSFDYIEWILRNELCYLPITVGAVTNDITKEVAEKLMVMYEECLKGNFTSVKILREEHLCSPSCSTSCNETTACLDPDQFREFKLVKKAQLSHNVAKFTFALPTPTSVLGLPIGQHICCRGKDGQGGEVIKSYTPTTLDSDVGHFELVIKRLPQARMSCYFHEMLLVTILLLKDQRDVSSTNRVRLGHLGC